MKRRKENKKTDMRVCFPVLHVCFFIKRFAMRLGVWDTTYLFSAIPA